MNIVNIIDRIACIIDRLIFGETPIKTQVQRGVKQVITESNQAKRTNQFDHKTERILSQVEFADYNYY